MPLTPEDIKRGRVRSIWDDLEDLKKMFEERNTLRYVLDSIQAESTPMLIRYRRAKNLLQMALDELTGERISGTWENTVKSLREFLEQKKAGLHAPPTKDCKHETEEGEGTIFLSNEFVYFNPINGFEVIVRCEKCGRSGFITLGGVPIEWEEPDGDEYGRTGGGGKASPGAIKPPAPHHRPPG